MATTFEVIIEYTTEATFHVEAENEVEAKAAAEELYFEGVEWSEEVVGHKTTHIEIVPDED